MYGKTFKSFGMHDTLMYVHYYDLQNSEHDTLIYVHYYDLQNSEHDTLIYVHALLWSSECRTRYTDLCTCTTVTFKFQNTIHWFMYVYYYNLQNLELNILMYEHTLLWSSEFLLLYLLKFAVWPLRTTNT